MHKLRHVVTISKSHCRSSDGSFKTLESLRSPVADSICSSRILDFPRSSRPPSSSMTEPTIWRSFQPQTLLQTLRGIRLVSPWLLHLLGTDILLSLLLPLSFVAPALVYHASSKLAYWIWKGIQDICTRHNGARITISGPRLPRHESALVIANHVSWTDFYLIQELAIKADMLPYCRWFAKQQLRWVPFLGWGLWAMGMPLISRDWDKDQRELKRVFKGPISYKWPTCQSAYHERDIC